MSTLTPEIVQGWADCPARAHALQETAEPRVRAEEVVIDLGACLVVDDPGDWLFDQSIVFSETLPTKGVVAREAQGVADSLAASVRAHAGKHGVESVSALPKFAQALLGGNLPAASATLKTNDGELVWLWRYGDLPHRYEVGTLAVAASSLALAAVIVAHVGRNGVAELIDVYDAPMLETVRAEAQTIMNLVQSGARWENPLSRNCTSRRCPRIGRCASMRGRRHLR